MKYKTIILTTLIIMLFIPVVSAQKGHTTLLTVYEEGNETLGGTADLYLEIKPGTGRVFIDSYPLTKIDTQISTRYAQQIACDFLEKDCTTKDFFYTIRAKSNIVGGPSASGAMTILTILLLEGEEINQDITMTGTINSGGIIGAVAGIKEKTEAAKDKGLKKILIPKWSIVDIEENNKTQNNTNETPKITYAENYTIEGIQVIPITTIQEALKEFTGKQYETHEGPIKIPTQYQEIMKQVSNQLCERAQKILENLNETNQTQLNSSINYLNKSKEATKKDDHYSAASFCFSANTRLREIQYQNETNQTKQKILTEIQQKTKEMLNNLEKIPIKTISNLETYIIVKERLTETQELIQENKTEALNSIGYITERFYSAIAWSKFFEYKGKEIQIDEKHLKQACQDKIAEVQERQEYLNVFIQGIYEEDKLPELRKIEQKEDYAFCLFRASKYKADINSIISTISLTIEKMPDLTNDKLKIAQAQINKQGESFPILGYSYYNYAQNLQETDKTLALLFSEYSIELSNLDIYFPKKQKINISIDYEKLKTFTIGLIIGIIATLITIKTKKSEPKKRNNPPKRKTHSKS
ncbi:hypothetical protein K9L97_05210 [Candidatus Woesearchaeota archaeon]|nr:hypothetical protein [Candidatus Woesearchaeota archaeon]